MRCVLAALCLAALPISSSAQDHHQLFPRDTFFRSPLADPAEPSVYVSRLEVTREDGSRFSAGITALGVDFGLLRWRGAGPQDGWQLSFFGSIDSLFNFDLPSDALMNTDYRTGFPLIWRSGEFAMRARLYHQSSHLGDELILGGNAPAHVDMSFEVVDLLLAWQRAGWRLYGGGGSVVHSGTDRVFGASLHAGFDYVSRPVILGQRLTAGVDLKWLEAINWRSGVSARAGMLIGRHSGEERGVTLLLEHYDGFAPFGQFFLQDFRYWGARVQFDF